MLKKVENDIYKCLRCGWCREKVMEETKRICPARELIGFESSFARGRVLMARGILEGEIHYNDKLIERMYTCLGCGACKVHCPLEVDTVEIFRAMREDAVEKQAPQPEVLTKINAVIEQAKNPFGKDQSDRDALAREYSLPNSGQTLYFAGCYDTLREPKTFGQAVKLLKSAGFDPAYLGEDEFCCGVPQIWNGSTTLARELAAHNVEMISEAGAQEVVMSCAGCYNAVGRYYQELVGDLPFTVSHISQVLSRKAAAGELKLNNLEDRYPFAVTYHDPCHLGRHMGIYDEPRILIKKMFPAAFQEMPRNRENAWCCGGGAVVYPYLTQYSLKIAAGRVAEADSIGAKLIITACPSCVNVLKIPARRKKIEVKNLLELVAEAVDGGK